MMRARRQPGCAGRNSNPCPPYAPAPPGPTWPGHGLVATLCGGMPACGRPVLGTAPGKVAPPACMDAAYDPGGGGAPYIPAPAGLPTCGKDCPEVPLPKRLPSARAKVEPGPAPDADVALPGIAAGGMAPCSMVPVGDVPAGIIPGGMAPEAKAPGGMVPGGIAPCAMGPKRPEPEPACTSSVGLSTLRSAKAVRRAPQRKPKAPPVSTVTTGSSSRSTLSMTRNTRMPSVPLAA